MLVPKIGSGQSKKEYTEKMLKICREIGTPMVKGTFEHCTEANTGTALAAGAWAAISVQLWCGMIAKKVADLVKRLGNGRIIIDSESSGLLSGPLRMCKSDRCGSTYKS